ncbi:MAG: hypothetical protein K2X32_09415 [Phycisphaerales bacterium]|nr:hypothetical protein [Phycisphaerales bacterium]
MDPLVLLLEDDRNRVDRMRAALGPQVDLRVWSSARRMIDECAPLLDAAALISLDHDLESVDGDDPGDGVEMAKYLVTTQKVLPVIIHTSNAERGRWMVGEFELAGWPLRRVLPFGERWIETEWLAEVLAVIGERA